MPYTAFALKNKTDTVNPNVSDLYCSFIFIVNQEKGLVILKRYYNKGEAHGEIHFEIQNLLVKTNKPITIDTARNVWKYLKNDYGFVQVKLHDVTYETDLCEKVVEFSDFNFNP